MPFRQEIINGIEQAYLKIIQLVAFDIEIFVDDHNLSVKSLNFLL